MVQVTSIFCFPPVFSNRFENPGLFGRVKVAYDLVREV